MRFLLLLFSFFISSAYAAKPVIICTQSYALCTSAPCVPDPRHAGFAICACDVEQGPSAGYTSCKARLLKVDRDKSTRLVSTFSFAQFDAKHAMNCPAGNSWTDCVDAPCTVNPLNHAEAICSCPLKHTAFFTFGGDCNTKSCGTGFWSGQIGKAGIALRNAMFKKLKITKNPWPDSACPVSESKREKE